MNIFTATALLLTFSTSVLASTVPTYNKNTPTDIQYKAGYGKGIVFEGMVGQKVVFAKKVGDNVKFTRNVGSEVTFQGEIGNGVVFNLNIPAKTVVTRVIKVNEKINTIEELKGEEAKKDDASSKVKFLKGSGKVVFKGSAGEEITFHEDVGSITFNKNVGAKVNFKGKIGKDVVIDVEIPANMQTRKELADGAQIKDVKALELADNAAIPALHAGKCMGSLVLLAGLAVMLF